MMTLTDLQTRRAGLSASAELLGFSVATASVRVLGRTPVYRVRSHHFLSSAQPYKVKNDIPCASN